jgi:xanthine dehydrogenase accessory factor
VIAAWPEEAFAQLGGIDRATAIAVLTHDPKLDDAALILALRSDAGYIGAMGSRRAQASRRERLLAQGIGEEELARVAAPIGLDLGALTAEETALSIMAEIVAAKHGHPGGRLAQARGRIHEVGV